MAMVTASELATATFYEWEERGRGYRFYPHPVALEPVLEPFLLPDYTPDFIQYKDPKERTSFLDGFKNTFKSIIDSPKPRNRQEEVVYKYTYPDRPIPFKNTRPLKGYKISAPKNFELKMEEALRFLNMASSTQAPISFEIIGTDEEISIQYVCRVTESDNFIAQFRSYFPQIAINEVKASDLPFDKERPIAIVDMGLQQEFMRPIFTVNRFTPDPLIGILAALEQFHYGEIGMVQVLFQGCVNAWGSTITDAVSDGEGGSFFEDAPDMVKLAQEKTQSPLYACVIRVAAQGNTDWRGEQIATSILNNLSSGSRSSHNQLIGLPSKGYAYEDHLEGLYRRQSNRLGMILNSEELTSLVHIPSASVTSSKLSRQAVKSTLAPKELLKGKYLLGTNVHLGQSHKVYLDDEYKKRHVYIIGNTGQGKSTLIVNMLLNDADIGNGAALFDPHGDVIDDVVARIPKHRRDDVILFDPSDTEYPIGFNLLQAKTDIEKIVLSSDLVEVFKSRSTSWGDTMTAVLSNAINAFLESEKGGTLLELRRFLLDPKFRVQYLNSVEDYSIRSYWEHDFKQLRKGSISPLLTRLDTFLRPRIIRNMMAQKEGIDFGEVMNGKKILLVKLAQGLIGEENSYLLGTLLLTKLQQAAQARASMSKEDRHPYYIYIDEFHNFITPSMSAILSGARKYGLGLVLANQQVSQISSVSSSIADSVLSNPAVRICFRVGDKDAKALEPGFSHYEASDLQNLERGQCIVRVGRNDYDFNLNTSMFGEAPDGKAVTSHIVEYTHSKYASNKRDVEAIVKEISQFGITQPQEEKQEPKSIVAKEETVVPESEVTAKTKELTEQPETPIEEASKEYLKNIAEQEQVKEHRYIQEYIKKLAEQNGFKAIIEETLPQGGRVDVSLSRENVKIACEVSVTNTPDYEVKNINKCFEAGYDFVCIVSNSDKHLESIKKTSY